MMGVVVWFTGLPAAGKTTLAKAVKERLASLGYDCMLLDSDDIRARLLPDLGYNAPDRHYFYGLLARLAAWLAHEGKVVLVAATANRKSYRNNARELAPRFYEVFVDTPQKICAERDPKGLYQRASAADGDALPGVGVEYEAPRSPDVVAAGGHDEGAVEAIVVLVEQAQG